MTELAKGAGLSQSAVFHLYHERVKGVEFTTLDKLCRYLECEVSDLLQWEPGPQEQQKK